MPIIRKLMNLRTSRAVCLPKTWLDFIEKEEGVKIMEVTIEVNGALIIKPIVPSKGKKKTALGDN